MARRNHIVGAIGYTASWRGRRLTVATQVSESFGENFEDLGLAPHLHLLLAQPDAVLHNAAAYFVSVGRAGFFLPDDTADHVGLPVPFGLLLELWLCGDLVALSPSHSDDGNLFVLGGLVDDGASLLWGIQARRGRLGTSHAPQARVEQLAGRLDRAWDALEPKPAHLGTGAEVSCVAPPLEDFLGQLDLVGAITQNGLGRLANLDRFERARWVRFLISLMNDDSAG